MNKNVIKVICLILCLLCFGGIYYNSNKSGKKSHSMSVKVISLIKDSRILDNPLVNKVSNKLRLGHNKDTIVRKYAHGIEFFTLAILVALTLFSFGIKGKGTIVYILFIVLLTAVGDEFHQFFIAGRSSSVIDVVIDFTGGCLGTGVFYTVYYSFKKIFKHKIVRD